MTIFGRLSSYKRMMFASWTRSYSALGGEKTAAGCLSLTSATTCLPRKPPPPVTRMRLSAQKLMAGFYVFPVEDRDRPSCGQVFGNQLSVPNRFLAWPWRSRLEAHPPQWGGSSGDRSYVLLPIQVDVAESFVQKV